LAESWAPDPAGAAVTLGLRPDLRFDDGSPLDAAAAVEALRRRWADSAGIIALGRRTLRIRLDSSPAFPPAVLADPLLGMVRVGAAGSPDPPATGPFRLQATVGAAIVAAPRDTSFAGPVLRFTGLPPGLDPRDALDRGWGGTRVDVLVTRDPAVLDYARGRPELRVIPLAWDRTYAVAKAAAPAEPSPEERGSLARDAVRAEARAAEPPFWWNGGGCAPAAALSAASREPAIAYPRGDPTARELAERLLAIAVAPNPPAWLGGWARAASGPPRLLPFDSPSPPDRGGPQAAAVIVALPRFPPFQCVGLLPASGQSLVPLIDTRAHLVVRGGTPAILIEGDGTFVLQPRRRR
jgi:hypothetical protein